MVDTTEHAFTSSPSAQDQAKALRLEGMSAAMMAALLGLQDSLAANAAMLRKSKDKYARSAGTGLSEVSGRIRDLIKVVNGDDTRTRSVVQNFPTEITYDDPQPDLSQPVPLILRRARDGEVPDFWVGGKSVHRTKYWALRCMRLHTPEYDRYNEAKSFLRLKVVSDYSDHVEYGDVFADTIEELFEDLEGHGVEEMPSYVHTCRTEPFEPDFESLLESYLSDEHHEDAPEQLHGLKDFLEAAETFVKLNEHVVTWWSTGDIVVVDQARFDAERAEAEAIVKAWEDAEPPYDGATTGGCANG